MHRPAAAITLLFCLCFALPLYAVTPSNGSAPAEVAPAPAQVEADAPDTFAYGPILAEDPDARARIRQLYREQYDLELAARDQISDVAAAAAAETDPDLRLQLERDAMGLKESHLVQLTEIGLEIAQLNGDEQRVAEYELALDQMMNPERYLPVSEPSVEARERARDAGLE